MYHNIFYLCFFHQTTLSELGWSRKKKFWFREIQNNGESDFNFAELREMSRNFVLICLAKFRKISSKMFREIVSEIAILIPIHLKKKLIRVSHMMVAEADVFISIDTVRNNCELQYVKFRNKTFAKFRNKTFAKFCNKTLAKFCNKL
jgi:hypothetical protein